MKATLLLQKLNPERLLKRHQRRHARFMRWGEQINARGLMVTEDEIRYHHRLEALSSVEKLAN